MTQGSKQIPDQQMDPFGQMYAGKHIEKVTGGDAGCRSHLNGVSQN